MKKFFLFTAIMIIVVVSCTDNKQSPTETGKITIQNVSTGNPKNPASTRNYTWRETGIIESETKDSVTISITSDKDGWRLFRSFKKPSSFKKNTGDTVSVVGTAWSGGYEGGWLYSIN